MLVIVNTATGEPMAGAAIGERIEVCYRCEGLDASDALRSADSSSIAATVAGPDRPHCPRPGQSRWRCR